MKKRIIRISDISEVDTSKISVYDLNNRYVDPLGTMFGLKYNRDQRRIEIIKLERIHSSEMLQYQRKIMMLRDIEQNQPVAGDLKTLLLKKLNLKKFFLSPMSLSRV
jgi:tRNA A37 threonylcarbamoyladenosine dehydratase